MKYKDINDYELLYMIKDGDDAFIEIIFSKYRPMIKFQLNKWKKYAQAINLDMDDLEQEVNYAIVEAINSYDESKGATFCTYLNYVIKNTVITTIRKHTALKNIVLNNAISLSTPISIDGRCLEETIADACESLEMQVINRYQNYTIFSFCYDLPITDACVYELSLNGYENKTISSLLSMDTKTVNYYITKNRKKLKDFLYENPEFMS